MSCSKEDTPKKEYTPEHTKLINQVTDGVISTDESILIHFNGDINKKKLTPTLDSEALFEFSPSIEGRLHWKDKQTLEFIPSTPLKKHTKYSGHLNLNVLLPEETLQSAQFPIRFSVQGNQVKQFIADYQSSSTKNPKMVYLKGHIEFQDSVSFDAFQKDLSFSGDTDLRLTWSEKVPNKVFTFTSSELSRENQPRSYHFQLDKSPFGLNKSFKRTVVINPINKLKILSVSKQGAGADSKMVIQFTDPLSTKKDWSSYVSVSPEVPTKVSVHKKQLVVTGPFQSGSTYKLTVNKGITSVWETRLSSEYRSELTFLDEKPRIIFANDGIYLPSENQKKIALRLINVKRFHLVVERIYESELSNFFKYRTFSGNKRFKEGQNYKTRNLRTIGEHKTSEWIEVNPPKNEWKTLELDLNEIMGSTNKGFYIVRAIFNINDIMYEEPESDEYNTDTSPLSLNYYRNFGKAEKYLLLTDLALNVKMSESKAHIYVSNVLTTEPESGARVRVLDYYGKSVRSGTTDRDGKLTLRLSNAKSNHYNAFVEVEKGDQSTFLKLNSAKWDATLFKTSGERVNPSASKLFLYTERGVHRPGDTIYLSGIARNSSHTFPNNHPIRLEVVNPNGQLVKEMVNKTSKDGMFSFSFKTDVDAPTGSWIATVHAGSKTERKVLKIETIVPDKFLVKHNFDKEELIQIPSTSITLSANYLFGTPASNMRFVTESKLSEASHTFKDYPNFNFKDETKSFMAQEGVIKESTLDERGSATFSHTFADVSYAPGKLKWDVITKVFEPGGRFTKHSSRKIYHPYTRYVGIQKPNSYWLESGNPVNLNVVLVDTKGTSVPNKRLTYRVYANKEIWWYDYGSKSSFKKRYKENKHTVEIDRGELVSIDGISNLEFTPTTNGEVLLEVTDPESGHTSALFLHAYSWGDSELNAQAYHVSIQMDKKRYTVGDVAQFSVPTPALGKVVYSIEKNDKVLLYTSKNVSGGSETVLEVPITEEMAPNAYISLSIVQPHSQTKNDRPIRLFGISPVFVYDPNSEVDITFNELKKIEPNETFTVSLNTKKQTQVTLAVVDEGLLSLTQFKTPDPWIFFNQKEMHQIDTYDSYLHFIGADWGETFKSYKIGGDYSSETGKDSAKKQKLMRFKPTVLFKGPMYTDANGDLSVSFKMPEYIGAVRIMAVATKGDAYGSKEMRVPVKTDLMMLPTLPRELGPKDSFTLPVSIFSMKNSPQDVEVEIRTEGPINVKGDTKKQLSFKQSGDKNISFEIDVEEAIGPAKVILVAKSKTKTIQTITDIEVKASNPRIYHFSDKILKQNQPVSFTPNLSGIRGTNQKKVSISRLPKFSISHRLDYLIKYPYGCIEQTTSSVFPQLFLSSVLPDKSRQAQMDKNINAGIQRLKKFQIFTGGLSYWPGSPDASLWGTNYATHFVVEARKKGYAVSETFYNSVISFQKRQARKSTKADLNQLYRLYILALANEAELSAMNQIKESGFLFLNSTSRWLLASAYKLAGYPDVANDIVSGASTDVDTYTEFAGTYGSDVRDRAMILESCVLLGKDDEAMMVYKGLIDQLSSQTWYSTQTLAYSLLSVGKFMESKSEESSEMSGTIQIGSKKIPFKTSDIVFSYSYTADKNDPINITLTTDQSVYAFYEWNGIPLREGVQSEQKKFNLDVSWYDEEGNIIFPEKIEQGKSFYGHFRVTMNNPQNVDEVVLDQIIPTGWEIENLRLNDEALPSWMSQFKLDKEEYLDIRDGRIMWFFDFRKYQKSYDFVVKLNAITAGKFFLAPSKVEAMYNKKYRAVVAGKPVVVTQRNP